MRQIKFRAWLESGNKMLDWEYLKDKSDVGNVISGNYPGYHPMQFTGLLDKNGKEIYDGDILKSTYTVGCKVEWGNQANQASWILVWSNNEVEFISRWANKTLTERIDLEIIGNIYDNPELLK